MFGRRQAPIAVTVQAPERRGAVRETIEIPATVYFNGKAVPCMTVNLSDQGVRLRLLAPAILPNEMALSVPQRSVERRARAIWRSGEHVGLEYV
jgi:hypothetical protein